MLHYDYSLQAKIKVGQPFRTAPLYIFTYRLEYLRGCYLTDMYIAPPLFDMK